ncbi:MAG TPA: mechanosensitive ion channel domain-containing protein [Gemmatimonadaceae bacterium]
MQLSRLSQNPAEAWLVAGGVFVVTVIALLVVKEVAIRWTRGSAADPHTNVSELGARLLGRTGFFFFVIIALALASMALALPEDIRRVIKVVAVLGLLAQLGIWGNAAISFWVKRTGERSADASTLTLVHALSGVARLALVIILLLLALDNFGVNTTALVAGLGISGLALALAIQSTLADLFATLSIVLDKPFVVGDLIELDTFAGRVERIGIKTTRLRSVTGEQIIIGNGDLLRGRIRNHRRTSERRGSLAVRVSPETPRQSLPAVSAGIGAVTNTVPGIRLDHVALREIAPSGAEFEIVYYAADGTPAGTALARQKLVLAISDALEAAGTQVVSQSVVARSGLG